MQNHEYFKAIRDQMDNGGREAMLYDLQHVDLSNFDPRRIPVTAALQDQKFRSMQPVEKWWLQKLQEGRLLARDEGWQTEVLRDDLLQDYVVTTRRDSTQQDLRNQLVKLVPTDYPREGPRRSVGSDRKRTWLFPNLTECRSHFTKVFGMVDPWPEP
jgi:hypothetical protein